LFGIAGCSIFELKLEKMIRQPSKTEMEFGVLCIQNIKISDNGLSGALVEWNPPAGNGGFADFAIDEYHSELIDGAGATIPGSRFPEMPGGRSLESNVTFADYPNNPNHVAYNPLASPPLARIKIVCYSMGIAKSSIIIEDIAIKTGGNGFFDFVSRLSGRVRNIFE